MHHFKITAIALSLAVILMGFTNCKEWNDSTDAQRLSEQNYFSTEPPASFCGMEGFEFLMENYFSKHCTLCHDNSGFSMIIIDATDISRSYVSLSNFGVEQVLETVTHNRFCGDSCNLETNGEMYKAIVEWLDCP